MSSSKEKFSDLVSNFVSEIDKYQLGDLPISQLQYFKQLILKGKELLGNEDRNNEVDILLDCIHMFLRCIIEYAGAGNAALRSLHTRQLCSTIVAAIQDFEITNDFIKKLSIPIFEILIDPELQPWIAKEILRVHSDSVRCSDKAVRRSVIQQKGSYYMGRLLDLIPFGDYEFQSMIVEIMYRMCKREELYEMEKMLCFKNDELRNAFLTIDTRQFDVDTRLFLNVVNNMEKNVISLLCYQVYFDDILLEAPPELDSFKGMWIDFNVKVGTITFFVNNIYSEDDQSPVWGVVTIFSDNISSADICHKINEDEESKKEVIGKFTLKGPCHICNKENHKLSKCRTLVLYSSDVKNLKK
ncbi:hypothetical protein HHI36_014932 [Cryptolaemus montrouzieri]|uniref:Synaptonemal complex protein 2 Spt16M-like domain-containing protein n=1 Tax=Cryptolaemus montrouzieri TaxID=559131 RepID=A0ABD2N5B1_9CUCU